MLLKRLFPITIASILFSTAQGGAIYLGNCMPSGDDYYSSSRMVYYDTATNGAQTPKNGDIAIAQGPTPNTPAVWEVNLIYGIFGSGARATTYIEANAQTRPVGQYAGFVVNNYGTKFNCYRDNESGLFENSIYKCKKIYYCLS